jgi:hypothetical protein
MAKQQKQILRDSVSNAVYYASLLQKTGGRNESDEPDEFYEQEGNEIIGDVVFFADGSTYNTETGRPGNKND